MPVALSNVILLNVNTLLSELKLLLSVVSCPVEDDPVHGFKHEDPKTGRVRTVTTQAGARNRLANRVWSRIWIPFQESPVAGRSSPKSESRFGTVSF